MISKYINIIQIVRKKGFLEIFPLMLIIRIQYFGVKTHTINLI